MWIGAKLPLLQLFKNFHCCKSQKKQMVSINLFNKSYRVIGPWIWRYYDCYYQHKSKQHFVDLLISPVRPRLPVHLVLLFLPWFRRGRPLEDRAEERQNLDDPLQWHLWYLGKGRGYKCLPDFLERFQLCLERESERIYALHKVTWHLGKSVVLRLLVKHTNLKSVHKPGLQNG